MVNILKNARHTLFFSKYDIAKMFYTLLFTVYLALFDISYITDSFRLYTVAIGIGLAAFMLSNKRIRHEYAPIYMFVGLLIVSILLSSLVVSRTQIGIGVILSVLCNTGIAMLLRRGSIYSWGPYAVFYGLSLWFIKNMIAGVPVAEVLAAASFNGISLIMLQTCIPLYVVLTLEGKKIDLKPALLTLVISIWAIGSSGIISSCILLSGLFFTRFKTSPKKVFYSAIVLLFLSYLFYNTLSEIFSVYLRVEDAYSYLLAKETTYTGRTYIWLHYFNNLDLTSILFGVDVLQDGFMTEFLHNYHNSFIYLHSQTGFMGLLIPMLLLLTLYKYFKQKSFSFFFLLAMMFRSSTDMGNFFTLADFIFYFYIFDLITPGRAGALKRANRSIRDPLERRRFFLSTPNALTGEEY